MKIDSFLAALEHMRFGYSLYNKPIYLIEYIYDIFDESFVYAKTSKNKQTVTK